jgi:hypothetical protein
MEMWRMRGIFSLYTCCILFLQVHCLANTIIKRVRSVTINFSLMNKTYLLVGVAAVGALLLGGFMMQKGAPKDSVPVDTKTADVAPMSASMHMKHSLKDFLSLQDMMKCTFANEDTNSLTEGVTFVSNGKVRSDTKTTVKKGNTTMTNSSIIDGGVMYAWGSEMPGGIKMSLSTMADMKTKAETTPNSTPTQATDYDMSHDYNCEAWTVDASVFVPPTTIAFTDYGEMMKKMMGENGMGSDSGMFESGTMEAGAGMKKGDANMCLACDQAPTPEAKAQCKIAMGCK